MLLWFRSLQHVYSIWLDVCHQDSDCTVNGRFIGIGHCGDNHQVARLLCVGVNCTTIPILTLSSISLQHYKHRKMLHTSPHWDNIWPYSKMQNVKNYTFLVVTCTIINHFREIRTRQSSHIFSPDRRASSTTSLKECYLCEPLNQTCLQQAVLRTVLGLVQTGLRPSHIDGPQMFF